MSLSERIRRNTTPAGAAGDLRLLLERPLGVLGPGGVLSLAIVGVVAPIAFAAALLRDNDLGLALCIGGGAVAALWAIVFLYRAALDREAKYRASEEAHRMLQESIDALPSGLVLYDHDERLVAFNHAAQSQSGGVICAANLGKSFPELLQLGEEASRAKGVPLSAPIAERLASFRRGNSSAQWRTFDGTWIERYERTTPSGGTLSIGVDITKQKSQEIELRRARDFLQATIDALPAGIVVYDKDERLVLFNKAATEHIPVLKDADAIGLPFDELARRSAGLLKAQGASVAPIEAMVARFRRRERQVMRMAGGRWTDWSEVPGPEGGTIGLRVDVTDLKQLEIAARRVQADYRTLVDSLADTVFRTDTRSGRIDFMSAAAAKLLGREPAELAGAPYFDFVVPEDHERIREALREAAKEAGVTRLMQYRMKHSSGAVRHVEVRFSRLLDREGRDTISGVIRDITDRVALEADHKREFDRLRAVFGARGAVMVLTDAERNIVMVNHEFERLQGVSAAQAAGRPLTDIVQSALDPTTYERWRAGPLSEADLAGTIYSNRVPDSSGHHHVYTLTATPLVDDQGLLSHIVFLGVDDTRRREAEEALHHAERLSTVGEMAGAVVHEIAQPLNVIELARGSVAEDAKAALEGEGPPLDPAYVADKMTRIGQQVERASRIVSDLRAFVRGSSSEEIVTVDPVEAVRAALDLTSHALLMAKVQTSANMPATLPPVTGRAGTLDQVLINLINNARDAGARHIDIDAGVLQRDGAPWVRIRVGDDGPGIPADVLPKLFAQLVTTKPKGKGTGLGLRICRRIVEEMGGTIVAGNRPQGGASFEILLPTAAPES